MPVADGAAGEDETAGDLSNVRGPYRQAKTVEGERKLTPEPTYLLPWPGADASFENIVTIPSPGTIFEEDQTVRSIPILLAGFTRIEKRGEDGTPVTARFLGANAGRVRPLGVIPACLGLRHVATAVALNRCQVAFLPRKEFDRLIENDYSALRWFFRMQVEDGLDQFEHSVAMTQHLDCRSRVEYIVVTLFKMAGVRRPDGCIRLDIPVTPQDLADLAKFSRVQVARVLTELERDGALIRTAGWLTIPPHSLLTALVNRS